MSSQLQQLASAPTAQAFAELATSKAAVVENENVLVELQASGAQTSAAEAAVRAHRGAVVATYKNLLDALVPRSELLALDTETAIRWVDLPNRPVASAEEGVNVINAQAWQAVGQTGAGVRAAIIDLGFRGYPALLGTTLPASVDTSCSPAAPDQGDVHGAAVAEIVHAVAPSAQLFLAVAGTPVQLGNTINCLAGKGVTVINHSVGWLYSGPGDGRGVVESIIDAAVSGGIFWANSAGNNAQAHWAGPWVDDGTGLLKFQNGRNVMGVRGSANHRILAQLRWNDPWGAACNDYDLYLFEQTLQQIVARSENVQSCHEDPTEVLAYTPAADAYYYFVVRKFQASGNANFDIMVLSQDPVELPVFANSLTAPADSANPGMATVGAVAWNTPTTLEYFSSQGPTTDGRIKPDLVAPDRVGTASYAPNSFPGTSAASPHVAGAAALVKGANPSFTPAQVKSFLLSRVIDVGPPGPDNQFGVGRLWMGAPPTPAAFRLTVSKSGGGAGTVTSSPAGITCGATCSASFAPGTLITLAEAPASGSIFAGWNGACALVPAGCQVALATDQTIEAVFVPQPAIGASVMAVWRLHKVPNHLFTASTGERDSAISQFGWGLEGVGFCVPNSVSAGLNPVYRLNKGNEFLYTFSAGERDNAVANFGYVSQGTAFYANMSPGAGLTPVHRLNNGLEHIYIQDPNEIQIDITQFGYHDEGVALYAPSCS